MSANLRRSQMNIWMMTTKVWATTAGLFARRLVKTMKHKPLFIVRNNRKSFPFVELNRWKERRLYMGYSEWITLAGVVATSFFSFLVWIATKKSADVAKVTLELNKSITQREKAKDEEYRKIMRNHILNELVKDSKTVHDAVISVDEMVIHKNLMSDIPTTLNVDIEVLAKYFTEYECNLIIEAWDSYNYYRETYFKSGYNDNGITMLVTKASIVIDKFHPLLETLEKMKRGILN